MVKMRDISLVLTITKSKGIRMGFMWFLKLLISFWDKLYRRFVEYIILYNWIMVNNSQMLLAIERQILSEKNISF